MAALEHGKSCSECGAPHNFFLPDDDLFRANAQYEYVCPTTNKTGRITSSIIFGKVVHVRPADAVIVKRVNS
jgi:hypothetical protein